VTALPLCLSGDGFSLVRNLNQEDGPIPAPERMGGSEFAAAASAIRAWDGYAATPLTTLAWAAEEAGVAEVLYKDESSRFGLQSFKALGGAYAVGLQVQGWRSSGRDPAALTVCCASDGNHGRSVAWGARRFGCKAVVFVPKRMVTARREAIERLGAHTISVPTYDDGIHQAADQAERKGWIVVSDTSYPGYSAIAQDVMVGYGLIAEEVAVQWKEPPTHLFLQAGVGGMAAALALRFQQLGYRPRVVICEAEGAACWFRSIAADERQAIDCTGTIQAGLDCGEPSLIAWEMMHHHALASCWISDRRAEEAVRALAHGAPPIHAGESAVAGLAVLLAAASSEAGRRMLALDRKSRILVLGSEGPTDPVGHARIVSAI
jgi:diaminopropionate ammonia-lyase